MPLTRTEAQQLDRLALAALDALRDMDRLAVLVATELDSRELAKLRDQLASAQVRRDATELALLDAIHGMVRDAPPGVVTITSPCSRRRWTTFLGR